MTLLTSDQLELMLTDYGWTFEALGDNTWVTGFQGEQKTFPLFIQLSATCVSFEVRPLVDLVIEATRYPNLTRHLLELNDRLQLVKIAVNKEGEVTMSAQLLSSGFTEDSLYRVLGIIGYYADEVAPEIYHRVAKVGTKEKPVLLC